jgi:hypothetical protein
LEGTIVAANLGSETVRGNVFDFPGVELEPLQVKIIQR